MVFKKAEKRKKSNIDIHSNLFCTVININWIGIASSLDRLHLRHFLKGSRDRGLLDEVLERIHKPTSILSSQWISICCDRQHIVLEVITRSREKHKLLSSHNGKLQILHMNLTHRKTQIKNILSK